MASFSPSGSLLLHAAPTHSGQEYYSTHTHCSYNCFLINPVVMPHVYESITSFMVEPQQVTSPLSIGPGRCETWSFATCGMVSQVWDGLPGVGWLVSPTLL